MFTITDFKCVATMTHDNTESASAECGRTWGLSLWRSLWAYKEYTAKSSSGQTFVYRTGRILSRHSTPSRVEFTIDGNHVSKYAFLKALNEATTNGIIRGVEDKTAPATPMVAVAVKPSPRVIQPTLF